MTLIIIALVVSAIYSGGMYLWCFAAYARNLPAFRLDRDASEAMERHTFHLGLCFILSVGFLGLILGEM